jgi:hypothetical protein
MRDMQHLAGNRKIPVPHAPPHTQMTRFLKPTLALAFAAMLAHGLLAQVIPPQGRLTLTNSVAVMNSDVTNTSTVYYQPYAGGSLPLWNGTAWTSYFFGSPMTLTLSSTYQTSGNIYDIYAFLDSSSVLRIGVVTVPWYTLTTRWGSGLGGCSDVSALNGIWVNAQGQTLNNGSSTYNPAAQRATYLGSIYTTGNGETSVQFHLSAASGGSNPVIGLWNAYNRVKIEASEFDSKSSWTYVAPSGGGIQPADNSTNNRITYLDGLAQTNISAKYQSVLYPVSQGGGVGVGIDSTSAFSGLAGAENSVSTVQYNSEEGKASSYPLLGLHYVQALEGSNNTNTLTLFGTFSSIGQSSGLFLDTEF